MPASVIPSFIIWIKNATATWQIALVPNPLLHYNSSLPLSFLYYPGEWSCADCIILIVDSANPSLLVASDHVSFAYTFPTLSSSLTVCSGLWQCHRTAIISSISVVSSLLICGFAWWMWLIYRRRRRGKSEDSKCQLTELQSMSINGSGDVGLTMNPMFTAVTTLQLANSRPLPLRPFDRNAGTTRPLSLFVHINDTDSVGETWLNPMSTVCQVRHLFHRQQLPTVFNRIPMHLYRLAA